jgi:hypothetical protein
MPRHFTRKIEIRFDDESVDKIDNAAKAYGMSRAEFIRSTALASCSASTSPEASSSPGKTLLTPDGYLVTGSACIPPAWWRHQQING